MQEFRRDFPVRRLRNGGSERILVPQPNNGGIMRSRLVMIFLALCAWTLGAWEPEAKPQRITDFGLRIAVCGDICYNFTYGKTCKARCSVRWSLWQRKD